jgi:uncharacterized protein
VEFEWDEAKRRRNLAGHGLDFRDAELMDWDRVVLLEVQSVDGEERELVAGPLRGGLIAVVHVERGGRVRLVSMRRATPRELRLWRAGIEQRWD